jgi:hypothetical protein
MATQAMIRSISSVALLVALVAAGCGRKDQAPTNPASPPVTGGAPEKKKEPAKLPDKADVVLDAAPWHAEFKKDAKAAKEKYKDKVIELSGVVDSVSDDPYDNVGYVFLKVENDILGVRCATTDKKPWIKVSPGSKVKVRGKVPEFGLPADLFSVEIVEAGPNPGVVISAAQLAKEYAADRKAATEKYNDKWAYLDGEVAEKTSSEFCKVLLKLKGEGGITVNCCCGGGSNQKPYEAIKAGSKVKMFGRLSMFDKPTDKEVFLNMSVLTEAK